MPRLSTRLKVASGYLILAILTIIAVYYVDDSLNALTESDGVESQLNRRQRITNDIVCRLYQAEIIGQTISGGQTENFQKYVAEMMAAASSADSLRTLINDSRQIARLDSVGILLEKKAANMQALATAIDNDNSDLLYRQYIDELLHNRDSLMEVPKVKKSEVTRTNNYTVVAPRKNFFGRLRDAFSRKHNDSTTVSNVVVEHRTDTVMQAFNPADTVARMLTDVRKRVDHTRLGRISERNRQVKRLQADGLDLSQKVGQLLSVIVEDSEKATTSRHHHEEYIRYRSAVTIAGIAFGGILLSIIFIVIIWRDITRSTRYRRQLEEANSQAEALLEAREQLMLTITHDIKAPVGSIIGFSELLKETSTDTRQQTYLNNMESSARHLLNLVNSLLDFHRLDAQKMDVSREVFNPRQLFDAIATSYQPLTAAKNLSLVYKGSDSLDRPFFGDPFRIRQVVENLLSNAVKFTQSGHVSLEAEIVGESMLSFSVSDTGCGIAPEEQERIFKEFTRLKNAQGQEGFGLGLAITNKLVALFDGHIDIESEKGKGSKFSVCIPLETTDIAETANNGLTQRQEPTKFNQPYRILIIDDDRLQLQLTSQMLKNAGADVATCNTPKELFANIENNTYDALLTDIQMPALNGFDLLKTLRSMACSQAKEIPVIAITARSDMDSDSLSEEGFSACLHKPFRQTEILEVIGKAIERHRPNVSLDFSPLTAFAEDDKDAAREIIKTFVSETKHNLQRMETALGNQDLPEMAETAHKLLPTYTMIGAKETIDGLTLLNGKRGCSELTDAERHAARRVIAVSRQIMTEATKLLTEDTDRE